MGADLYFMVIHKGEAPPPPAVSAFLAGWRRELEEAGVLGLALDFAPAGAAARLALGPGTERVERGPFPDPGTTVAGFTVIAAPSREAAVAQLESRLAAAGAALDGTSFEVRETGCAGGCPGVPPAPGQGSRWAVLLRSTPETEVDHVPAPAMLAALNAFNAVQAAAGVLLAGDGLKSSARGTRVTRRDGGTAVIDGPFAEAKELIAGFWMVSAASLDAAVAWARRLPYPTGPYVEVEIREVVALAAPAPGRACGLSPEQAHAEQALRTEGLDDALRAGLTAHPDWH